MEDSVFVYSGYGAVVSVVFGKIDYGFRYFDVACKLMEKYNAAYKNVLEAAQL